MLSVPIIARVVSLIPGCKRVYSIQHCVIKFVSDFRQVDVFFKGTLIFSTNKTIFLIYSKKVKKKIIQTVIYLAHAKVNERDLHDSSL